MGGAWLLVVGLGRCWWIRHRGGVAKDQILRRSSGERRGKGWNSVKGIVVVGSDDEGEEGGGGIGVLFCGILGLRCGVSIVWTRDKFVKVKEWGGLVSRQRSEE